MSDGKITLYLELEEAEKISDCLKQRESLLDKAIDFYQKDAKAYESTMKQLDKVTLDLGILFANVPKGPWEPYQQDSEPSSEGLFIG